VLIKDVFHLDVDGFGVAMAAFGVGGFLGAATSLLPLAKSVKRDSVALLVAIMLGLTIVAVGINRSSVLLMILLVLAGAALTISNLNAYSFLQQTAGKERLGRMASLFQLILLFSCRTRKIFRIRDSIEAK